MIVVLKPGMAQQEVQAVADRIERLGLKAFVVVGKERTIIGAIGDERLIVDQTLESFPRCGKGPANFEAIQAR